MTKPLSWVRCLAGTQWVQRIRTAPESRRWSRLSLLLSPAHQEAWGRGKKQTWGLWNLCPCVGSASWVPWDTALSVSEPQDLHLKSGDTEPVLVTLLWLDVRFGTCLVGFPR